MIEETMPAPAKQGPFGRAWVCDVDALRRRKGLAPDLDATIASWIVEARWAHPIWHSYLVVLIHLRPLAHGNAPKIFLEGATHEFFLFALNPNEPRAPAARGEDTARYMTPVNFAAQLIEQDDAAARSTIEQTVDKIIKGALNPDTDALRQWVALFGDHMLKSPQGAPRG